MAENDNDQYETDENGQVVKNKDGSPRKRRGRKAPAPEAQDEFATVSTTLPEDEAVTESSTEATKPAEDAPDEISDDETPMAEVATRTEFLGDVEAELSSAFREYGAQDRPHIYNLLDRTHYAAREREYKRRYAQQEALGAIGWDTTVLEKAFAAFAAQDPEQQYEGLVQVATTAMLAAASLKRAAQEDDE